VRSLIAAALLTMGLLTGCTEACTGLSASEKDKQAASDGYEVEKEDSMGNTCELSKDGVNWEVDD
jgi:hypothetical protein